jgi:hypothetical protein
MPKARAAINHGSVYSVRPQLAAENLARLTGGLARPFHPCKGAWVCFLSGVDEDWSGQLLEFYPRDVVLSEEAGALTFRKSPVAPRGAGTHFNLTIPKTRKALESVRKAHRKTA